MKKYQIGGSMQSKTSDELNPYKIKTPVAPNPSFVPSGSMDRAQQGVEKKKELLKSVDSKDINSPSIKEVKNLFKKTGGATYKDGELTGGTIATKTLPAPRPKSQKQLDQKAKLEQLREIRDKKHADQEIARQERRQDMLNKTKFRNNN